MAELDEQLSEEQTSVYSEPILNNCRESSLRTDYEPTSCILKETALSESSLTISSELVSTCDDEQITNISKNSELCDNEPIPSTSVELHSINEGKPIQNKFTELQEPERKNDELHNSDEYTTFIPGNGDTYPYLRDEYEFQLIFVISKPLLMGSRNCESVTLQLEEQKEGDAEFVNCFSLKCYPNGDSKENEGYISLIFEENTEKLFLQLCKLDVTLALLDADKSRRFPQSFTLDHFGMLDRYPERITFGLSRYIRREALLSTELFCDEKLLVQCDVKFYTIENVLDDSDVPFDLEESYDECGHHFCVHLQRSHPLWKVLCEHSQYFNKLIVTDYATSITLHDENEYQAFDMIAKCVMSGNEPSMLTLNFRELLNLYEYANYYLLSEFKQRCSELLKKRTTSQTVCEIVVVADMHDDTDLKKFATEYAVQHWRRVLTSKRWDTLNELRSDLVKEMKECRKSAGRLLRKRKRTPEADTEYVQQFPNMYQ